MGASGLKRSSGALVLSYTKCEAERARFSLTFWFFCVKTEEQKTYLYKQLEPMGKGDRRTKRGKIIKGSFGRKRPKKPQNVASSKVVVMATKKAKDEEE